MQNKINRQNKIKEILKEHHISSQEELVKILADDGIEVTQATLSRDFAELGVIKTLAGDGIRYTLNVEEAGKQVQKLIAFEILAVENNESLVVVRTLAGRAQGVAHYIDRMNSPLVLGTIAGDDTILLIPAKVNLLPDVVALVNDMMSAV